jgi:hypothetical protein
MISLPNIIQKRSILDNKKKIYSNVLDEIVFYIIFFL